MNPHNQAIFTSDINDDIVISFTCCGKPAKVSISEFNINDISDLLTRFGIDSFVFNTDTRHPCSPEQLFAIYKAILLAYSSH
jgi:hypothetical protein